MRKELEELSSVGLTTLAGTLRPGAPSIAAYKLLEQRGELNMRAAYGFGWDSFGVIENVDDGLKQFQKVAGSGSDLLWVNSTGPSSMDGSSTRACTNQKRSEGTFGPIDAWWPVGQCIVDSEFRGGSGRAAPIQGNYFKDWVMAMGRYRLRLANAHVAGDRSSGILLGFVEEIQKRYGPDATKDWAFDHCTMVDPANFQRIARARILYACAAQYIDRLSPEVAKSYGEKVANTFVVPAKSMLAAGVRVVFEARGTGLWRDFEIFETRMDAAGKVWGPQERLDRPTILKMATRTAAEYVLKGDQLGSIEAGKLADLVVLDRDYLTIPVEQVREIQPQMTVTNGRIVFVHPNFSAEYNLRPAGAVISTLKELQSRRKTAGGGE
jgi:hypothetical protein